LATTTTLQALIGVVVVVVGAALAMKVATWNVLAACWAGALVLPILAADYQAFFVGHTLPLLDQLPVPEGLEVTRAAVSYLTSTTIRLRGPFGDPNHFAVYLVFAVAIVAPLAMPFARRYGVNLLLMGMMVVHGALGGAFSPISVYGAFVNDLRRDGVLVFDPSEALAAARRTGPQYLATDTHWRPETMEVAAERLGDFIAAHVGLPVIADPGYRLERPEVRNTGDIARMLDLPDDARLFPPETVWLRRVLQADGSPWRSSRDADVLLLGDSFSNVYALESMGWGTSAGLAEQLSYTLRRPVDRLVQNDEGAFATRAMLRQDPGRLDGKRVVVYQFAARELNAAGSGVGGTPLNC